MTTASRFTLVENIGKSLPDVEVTTTWNTPALKVRGRMFVCIASHKSAEPDTLVVMMDFAQRDALIEEDPNTYYLREHYVGYPCVLVRLARVHPDALRDLIISAHRYMSARARKKPAARQKSAVRQPRPASRARRSARSSKNSPESTKRRPR